MKVSRTGQIASIVVVGALSLSACGSNNNNTSSSGSPSASSTPSISCASGDLKGAGSTFQKNIVSQWIKDYTAACTGATIDYQGIGSGAGIKQFGSGTIDFAGSDSTMKPDEQSAADKRCGSKAVHLPVTAGGVAIAYNLPSVKGLQLSPKTLAGIFQGTIKKWDAPEIKTDNPSASLPSTAITAVHREDSSGTTSVFTKFLKATAGAAWTLKADKQITWPASIQGASGSNGVTQAVAGAVGGITYVEKSYVDASGTLAAAKVQNSSGTYVDLTSDSVSAALANAKTAVTGSNIKVTIDFATVAGNAYPISTVSYDITCTTGKDAGKTALLKSFLGYALTTGQSSAAQLGYAPLPTSLVTQVQSALAALS